MPPSHEMATDDYVAELLAKEAGDCSLKYSAMGLDAFKLNKRPANQPKPNTRFLNNIIRDTTSHNRALLAKENAESRARLRDLEEADRRKRDEEERKIRRSRPGPSDTRKRMLGDIAAILGGPTKRRKPNDKENTNANTTSDRDEPDDRYDRGRKGKSRETRRAEDEAKPTSRRPARDRRSDSRDRHSRSRRHEERPRDRRSSPHETRDERERRPKHKERSPRGRDKDGRHRQHRRPERGERRAPEPAPTRDDDSGSDPLDDIIGPAPPPKATVRRGRGLNAAMSGIDSRFAADYDPTVDVTPDPDEASGGGDDDWDGAAEAFLDRQKWKQQGAERLRSAGFTEDQIRKWEKGDGKDESDVQWNKAGRVREWDRGKVVDADTNANVGTSPDLEFGRLKGT
ncbi:putative pre-mRNA-splicing factor 38B [Rosellinia necatrix]|uniref:Putative pre-mRNA-splicing factor 38B n=1 Tax=Rosellinia necatrix TaxID=77044 RepID=A0A1W2TS26_ROSNE|nr:putative pre-mRNA-splicing factor 38B [Rosellinia necatrix]